MAINNSKCSLQNLLTALLGPANQDQNQSLPPWVFTSMVNTVTGLLISALVKAYPENPQVVDVLDNFVRFKILPVQDGYFQLPNNTNDDSDYRDILGTPYIFINTTRDGECGKIPKIITPDQFRTATLKGGCQTISISILPESEFSYRTSSTYNYPTYEEPIGFFAGQKKVKICPYDLSKVALLYVKNELIYRMNYIPQPDDTYLVDQVNSIDTEWGNNAFPYLFKALTSLYAAYASDPDFSNWSRILVKEGIL